MSVRLGPRALSLARAYAELTGPGLGGIVLFAGRVRPDRVAGARVRALDYEVDRTVALERLRAIETTARRRFGAERTVLWHRSGSVAAGEVAVIVGAACAHRDPAFRAARYLIEELKRSVPIWKEVLAPPARRRRRRPARPAAR